MRLFSKKCCFKFSTLFIILFLLIQTTFPVLAATDSSFRISNRGEFENGTLSAISTSRVPGSIVLGVAHSQTFSTEEEFGSGNFSSSSLQQTAITSADDGGVEIAQGYSYTTNSEPSIGSEQYVRHSFIDTAHNFLYVSTSGGLSVINTEGTVDPADDTLVTRYHTGSTPALGSNDVFNSFLDTAQNLLYVSTYGGGLSVINTQGTVDPGDDTLVTRYHTGSSPALSSNSIFHSFLDTARNLLYVSTSEGLSVINTQGSVSPADDTLVIRYHTGSTPALSRNWTHNSFLDTAHNLLYVSTSRGLSVINTKGTVSPADDTLVTRYHWTSTPAALEDSWVNHSFLDTEHNLLYVSTSGGLSVINTQGTVSPADDTLVTRYHTGSTPALAYNWINHAFLDTAHNLLYVSTTAGLSVINTQGTVDPADDTLVTRYHTGSTPALANNYVYHSFIDTTHNLLYVPTSEGLSVIPFDEVHLLQGVYLSSNISLDSTPFAFLSWEEQAGLGEDIQIQTRTGITEAAVINNFDGTDTSSYLGDYYDWGIPFATAVASAGTLRLSNPEPSTSGDNQWVDFWFDTGRSESDPYPAGTEVTARIRINSEREKQTYSDSLISDEWSYEETMPFVNNSWIEVTLVPEEPFSKIGFDINWKTGTWNDATDSFEIDWIKIGYSTITWSEWSTPCSDSVGCDITSLDGADTLQYRAMLSSTEAVSSPVLNSVTLSRFESSGTFESVVSDMGEGKESAFFSKSDDKPAGTDIVYSYRSGKTSSPDSSWSSWQSISGDRLGSYSRYLQIRAVLSTTNPSYTPRVEFIGVNTDEDLPAQDGVEIEVEGKKITKKFAPLNLPDLSFVGDNDHPQFCFSKAYDTSSGTGIDRYTVKIDSRDYLSVPYQAPSVDESEARKDGEHAVIRETDSFWIRYNNYDRPSESQEICVYGKGDSYELLPGMHTWQVSVKDKAGNAASSQVRRFLVKSNGGSFSSLGAGWGEYTPPANPGFSQGEWFPLSILQIGNKKFTNDLSTTNPVRFDSTEPVIISSPNPTIFGIAPAGSKIIMTLEKETTDSITQETKREQVLQRETNANAASEWGMNLTQEIYTLEKSDSAGKPLYYLALKAEQGDRLGMLFDIPIQLKQAWLQPTSVLGVQTTSSEPPANPALDVAVSSTTLASPSVNPIANNPPPTSQSEIPPKDKSCIWFICW